MPYIGEIKGSKSAGLSYSNSRRVIWVACEECGEERWVSLSRFNQGRSKRCAGCAHAYIKEKSGHWKGGKVRHSSGYIRIRLYPDDFFYPMANKDRYVLEHRLVMATHLQRCLLAWEVVHHKNGDGFDNKLENLELLGRTGHLPDTLMRSILQKQQVEIEKLKARITELERG